jgi:hypothetical protein
MTANLATLTAAARIAGEAVTTFYCKSVGRGLDSNIEFSLLVNWNDAIEAAQAAALSARSWLDVSDMDAMQDECNLYLDIWHGNVTA